MQRLEVSGAVRPLYGSLGFKGLTWEFLWTDMLFCEFTCPLTGNQASSLQRTDVASFSIRGLMNPCCKISAEVES